MPLSGKIQRLFTLVFFVFLYSVSIIYAADNTSSRSLDQTVTDSLRPIFEVFSENLWVHGGVVILITFTISSLLTFLLFRLIKKLTNKTSMVLDDEIAIILRPPIYYTLMVIGITAGLRLMPLNERWDLLTTRCIRTIGILIWVVFFIRLSSMLLKRVAELSHKHSFIQHRTVTLFDNIAKVVIFGAGTYAVFVIWQIDMTAWLASAGIIGIAIGFAAKDSLSNLFAGVFILADAPYKVGDFVVLDEGYRGQVTNIGLRSTRILTRGDVEITVPNSIIGNTTIINQSGGRHKKLRVRLKVGVAYGSNVDQVKSILQEIADNESQACKFPEPRVRFRLFGASSLDFELLFWVDSPELRGRVLDAMNSNVYKKFQEENIEIPYSKQDVYIKGLPEALAGIESTATQVAQTDNN